MKKIVLLFFLALVLPSLAEINRCGEIQDDRSVYKDFYDPSNGQNILVIKLTVTNTSSGFTWTDILADRDKWDSFDPWSYCDVVIGDETSIPCEVKRRGDWAMESPLPSLRVKFLSKDDNYKDMDRLLLNKHPWDPTRIKNKLSYELLQEVPNLSSLYTHFVHLYVNGESYGLYTLLEDMRDDMMKTHGLKKSSYLYKANYVTWDLSQDDGVKEVTDEEYNKEDFEDYWDLNGEDDTSVLVKAYREVFDLNLDSQYVMENNFNVDNFATWLAFVVLTGNNDISFNNFGVYAPKDSEECEFPTPLYMMVWDNDGAWDENPQKYVFGKKLTNNSRPFYNSWGFQYFWNSRLVRRFYRVDSFVDLLISKMDWLIQNTLSPERIRNLTDSYIPKIRPILAAEPDASHLAWNSNINKWEDYVRAMHNIPKFHYNNYPDFLLRPMPVDAKFAFNSQGSSLLFWWDKSFIMKNRPLYYQLQVATNMDFSNPLVNDITNNTYYSIATSIFAPRTSYFWRLLIRNAASPHHYMTSYVTYGQKGWGIGNFTTPATLSTTVTASTVAPTNIATVSDPSSGELYKYATLDDINPTSSTPSPCSGTPTSIPEGWMLAPNSALTRAHLSSLALPWGGASLVLADGYRVSSLGKQLEGFGEFAQHVVEHAVAGGKAYMANCSVGVVHLLLTNIRQPVNPTDEPEVPFCPIDPTEDPYPTEDPNSSEDSSYSEDPTGAPYPTEDPYPTEYPNPTEDPQPTEDPYPDIPYCDYPSEEPTTDPTNEPSLKPSNPTPSASSSSVSTTDKDVGTGTAAQVAISYSLFTCVIFLIL